MNQPKSQTEELLPLLTSAVVILLVKGWLIVLMWQWFLVPIGIPPIGLIQAMGLFLLGRVFFPQQVELENKPKTTGGRIAYALAVNACTLVIAYLLHVILMT